MACTGARPAGERKRPVLGHSCEGNRGLTARLHSKAARTEHTLPFGKTETKSVDADDRKREDQEGTIMLRLADMFYNYDMRARALRGDGRHRGALPNIPIPPRPSRTAGCTR
ncbi:hypothetical protein EK904_000582 [Melospiza melodia maxima]|nr:hypothetical protein EK904_000582 [Melospiza melodia maxima]